MRFLLYAVPLVVTLYAFIDCVLTPRELTRTLPKWLWILVIVLVPLLGAVLWLFLGRPYRQPDESSPGTGPGGVFGRGRRSGPVAPDDDPAFLRQLADEEWQRKMRERREGGS